MTALVAKRVHDLAGTLAELKVRVRTALATELAAAVGTAVRDVLVVTMMNRLIVPPTTITSRPPPSASDGWRDDASDHDRWTPSNDPWSDDDDSHDVRLPVPSADDRDDEERTPAMPTAVVMAVGVQMGRWWLARQGTVPTAVGVGVLTTVLGFAGGPVARAALAVLAAATDLLNAESALNRIDPS